MLGRGILGAALVGTAAAWLGGAAAAETSDEPAAWSVEAVTRSGARYSGVVVNQGVTSGLFGDGAAADLSSLDPTRRIEFRWFNGLSGSIALKAGDLATLERVGTLTEDELEERGKARTNTNAEKWAKERARLAKVYDERARRAEEKAAHAAAAAEEAARSLEKLTEAQRELLDRFPPDDGWIPARKTQLYHQTVILNNRPLTDEERDWLDHYQEWKPAYDKWLDAEKKRIAAEAAAEQVGKMVPPGERSAPGGTAKSAAAEIDGEDPTSEETGWLPLPLEEDVPAPERVDETAPKPIPLSGSGG